MMSRGARAARHGGGSSTEGQGRWEGLAVATCAAAHQPRPQESPEILPVPWR